MSSPRDLRSPLRRTSFLLLQDEPPLAPKGHGALASLIRGRSVANLVSLARNEEDAAGGESLGDEPRRDERRMSAILNGPHMRSMRLIGNSNARYRWERYWKTEEQLAAIKNRKVFVCSAAQP